MTLSAPAAKSSESTSFGWIVTVTSLAFVMAQLDVSIVNIAMPQIAQTYQITISTLQWVIDAYTLAFAVLMLSAGSLSDMLGAKRIFQIGIGIFCIASIGCGLAQSATMLICFRALQGLGAATMIPSSLAILNQSFAHDTAKRVRAVGLWTAAGSSAIAAGPIIGGLLIQVSSWRYIFYVNVPLCLAALIFSLRLKKDQAAGNRNFDIPGQVTWMLCITTIIWAIIEWPQLGANSPVILISIIFSLIMLCLFLLTESKVKFPMLPLHLFKSADFNVLLLLGGLLNGAYYGTIFILSLYLQNVLHYSSLNAGLAFLPLTVGFVISNVASGKIINKYGIRLPIMIGLVMFALGFAGLYLAGEHTQYWKLFLPFLTISMGMGLAVPSMINGILASVDKSLSGTASAALNTVRQSAGAIGVAIIGTIASGGNLRIIHAISVSATFTVIFTAITLILILKLLKLKV
ncbi:MFS transporter, DHA2 family, methylenomycin A resistance protein [Pedobacter westerhofensis]|uniref:MFS transporter, DHA2 family, methylenomycin A resistance protein n=1 Tax=Pedobacter westerhofensis TaxID=425512 RepID=A0A521FBX5_9SPHI|nr:MFS transporter [Pedobacter westerhofensis]SMO93659.1 MFS transporter, DHA2 family, methylenomycin A resistance protein [Pedobacter westerhofensis]